MPAPKYPWDRWFKKKKFSIRKGEEYDCSQSAIIQQIRNAASLRSLAVSIQDLGNSIQVKVGG